MGCRSSKYIDSKVSGETTPASNKNDTRRSATESKVFQALLKKRMESVTSSKTVSFEKILLKFDKLRTVLNFVKTLFNDLAVKDGNEKVQVTFDGLKEIMRRLDVSMDEQEIADLFDFVDVQESKKVTFKEFLTALTIGMVLEVIPAFQQQQPAAEAPAPTTTTAADDPKDDDPKANEVRRSLSGLIGQRGDIKDMLNLIVSAYLIFDPDGKGFIERSGVDKMLQEHGSKGGNAMLSQQRWNEMDWDSNGTIDFAEFVYSFTSWVDIDEPE